MFKIDVKGQATKNFWLVRKRNSQIDLFYFLVYLPKSLDITPELFIFSSEELMQKREEYKKHIETKGGKYRDDLGGINWKTAFEFKNAWNKLPK